jgi:hypothetical protein
LRDHFQAPLMCTEEALCKICVALEVKSSAVEMF